MTDDLTAATHTQHEDPTGDAAASVATYLTVAIATAQAAVNRAAGRAQAATQQQEVEAARKVYAVMLARDKGRRAPAEVALAAWQAAQPWRDDLRDAAKAAHRAQDRLRVLHPQAMARYDELRAGLDPVAAMREVAPLIAEQITRPPAGNDVAAQRGASATDLARAHPAASEALAAAVRDALPDAMATAVLTDRSWPQLAEALHRAEHAGADPATVLAEVAGRRELSSATSAAQVLTYRLAHPTAPSGGAEPPTDQEADRTVRPQDRTAEGDTSRRASAVASAAQSFPIPLASASRPGPADDQVDASTASAGEVLAREAEDLANAGKQIAATPDDLTTAHVDEHHEGVVQGAPLASRSLADATRAQALLTQAERPASAPLGASTMPVFSSPQAAAAAQSFPSPVGRTPQEVRPHGVPGPAAQPRPQAKTNTRRR